MLTNDGERGVDSLWLQDIGRNAVKQMLGPACRKCDGAGFYCVALPLSGDPPDNRRPCEICGGIGYERIRENLIPDNPRAIPSLERDELIVLLRAITAVHVRYRGWDNDPVRVLVEESLQRMAISTPK